MSFGYPRRVQFSHDCVIDIIVSDPDIFIRAALPHNEICFSAV